MKISVKGLHNFKNKMGYKLFAMSLKGPLAASICMRTLTN